MDYLLEVAKKLRIPSEWDDTCASIVAELYTTRPALSKLFLQAAFLTSSADPGVSAVIKVKNTFVELNGSDCASVSRRARSESPKRIQYVANDHRTMQREWNAPVTVRKTLTFTARSKATSHSHASTISSYQTSVASVCTEDGALPAQVIVGTGNAANRFLLGTSVAPAPREIRISQGVMAKVGAFKSLGSIGHHEGWCVPCLMDGWHRKENSADTKACRNGIFCSRCHDDHGAEDLVAVRRLRRQRRRKAGEMARL